MLQDLSHTAAAMGLIMLEVEGTDLEGELRSTTDAVRRAAQGLRDAVNDLRLEEERGDRLFPELVKSWRRNRARPRLRDNPEVEGRFPTLLGETGTQLARVVQEAITNARRHSGARKVSVTLKTEGKTWSPRSLMTGGDRTGHHAGRRLERHERAGGHHRGTPSTIDSEAGRGTRVNLRAPDPQKG